MKVLSFSFAVLLGVCLATGVSAQQQAPAAPTSPNPPPAGAALPPGYVIGPDDVLMIVFWREKDMSA